MSYFQPQYQNNNNGDGNDDGNNGSYEPKYSKHISDLIGSNSPFGIYYTKLCEVLKSRGVPASRFPSREHFLSKMLSFVDSSKLEQWIKKYVSLETINGEESFFEDDINSEENPTNE